MAGIPVIIDADCDSDADDIGDQAQLAYFEQLGIIDVQGAGLCEDNPYAPGALACIYEHMEKTPVTPVGSWKGASNDSGSSFTQTLYNNYVHTGIGLASSLPDAVSVYRQVLAPYEAAGRPSVWLISTGGLQQISALLHSAADGYSASNGLTLVANSTVGLVMVAGRDGTTEVNTSKDTVASNYVCANWPTQFVWCDIGIGDNIVMGQNEWHGSLNSSCPIRVAYDLQGFGTTGRNCWSQLGIEYIAGSGYYATQNGNFAVDAGTGVCTWTPGPGRHQRLLTTLPAAKYAERWETQVVAHETTTRNRFELRDTTFNVAWTPSLITNVIDWADCSDTSKITAPGNSVSAVTGQLSVLTWSQGVGANQPTSGVNTINSKNVLDFGTAAGAGLNSFLDSGPTSYATTGCHYWIVKQTTVFDATGLPIFMDGTAANRAAFYADGNAAGKLSLYAGNYPNQSSQADDTSLHLLVGNFASGATSAIYVDGTSFAVGDPGSKTPTASRIGCDASTPTGFSSSHICAWGIGTSIMSSADRALLRTWAQTKFGTP